MMCGRSYVARSATETAPRQAASGEAPAARSPEPEQFFSVVAESPKGQVAASLSVLAPVALSGVFLVVFVPDLWWVFTTYFWIAFPALGTLGRGLAGVARSRPARAPAGGAERELLVALREHGELSSGRAAAETSLTVSEADEKLRDLATSGHLEVRARGGAIFYALWEAESPRSADLETRT